MACWRSRGSQTLAHGCVVVSETSPDQAEYADLDGRVLFTPEGDAEALIAALRGLLDDPAQLHAQRQQPAQDGTDRFRLGFLRTLQGLGMITPDTFEALATDYPAVFDPHQDLPRTCLTLPETPSRTRAFEENDAGDYLRC